MCGIVGYVGRGQRNATDVLMEGLHRLEYRGYDSAGVAVHAHQTIDIRKRVGRVSELARLLEEQPVSGSVGIGHTRWATHGGISDTNSHPHVGGNGEVVVVHNGVIENFAALRDRLQAQGYVFPVKRRHGHDAKIDSASGLALVDPAAIHGSALLGHVDAGCGFDV